MDKNSSIIGLYLRSALKFLELQYRELIKTNIRTVHPYRRAALPTIPLRVLECRTSSPCKSQSPQIPDQLQTSKPLLLIYPKARQQRHSPQIRRLPQNLPIAIIPRPPSHLRTRCRGPRSALTILPDKSHRETRSGCAGRSREALVAESRQADYVVCATDAGDCLVFGALAGGNVAVVVGEDGDCEVDGADLVAAGYRHDEDWDGEGQRKNEG